MSAGLARRNRRVAWLAGGAALAMAGLAFASVPLYSAFCRATGYGGTTQVAAAAPAAVGSRTFTVRFNADTAPDLPWRFRPAQGPLEVRSGQPALAYFTAENRAGHPVRGVAVFNVTPAKAGLYFNKVACFCFNEQTLSAGQTAEMPVSFFVDPAIAGDRNLDDVSTITLSYTFMLAPDQPKVADAGRTE